MSASAQAARLITAIFHDQASAEHAYQCVSERGYDERDIDLIMSDETHKRFFSNVGTTQLERHLPASTGHEAVLGRNSGAISAAVTAIGTSLVIPGVGLIVAGPTAAALSNSGAGAGGLIGALVDRGLPEEQVEHYEQEIKDGGILIGVRTESDRDAQYFEQQWKNHRAEHVYS